MVQSGLGPWSNNRPGYPDLMSGSNRAVPDSTLPLAKCSHIGALSVRRRVELKPELCPEFEEFDMPEILCEHVCGILATFNKENFNLTVGYYFPDIVVPDVDVLRSLLLHRVGGNEDRSLIISADRDRI